MNPDELLENLDAEQREAATSLVGPVCILAGAGTGKTRTITHRIAYGIAKGYFAANRIMALTYTNRAAGELRARLRGLGIPGVSVKTFHAAALSQLDYFWPQYAGVPAPNVLESKAKMLSEVSSKLKINLDTTAIRELAAEIEWRKFSMLSLAEYADRVSTRPKVAGLSAAKNLEIQAAYESAKIAAQRIDWEDVLVLTLGLLRAEPLALAHVQQQYRFYTVDEYQDISPLQHALLDIWMGDHTDLCVVGDPNQTIYSFTGASSSYLLGFTSTYPDATVVSLSRNYRSTPNIIGLANRLIRGETELDELVSQRMPGIEPRVAGFKSSQEEAANIADEIKRQISSGVKPNEIAILYRVNSQSEIFEKALADRSIDYQVRGGERFFNRVEIQAAIRGHQVVVVVSAMGDTTDELIDLAQSVSPDPYAAPREMDMLLTSGERISMALLAIAINAQGAKSRSFTGSQAGIETSAKHGDARISNVTPARIQEAIDAGDIAIVAGFQGFNRETKDITTLGRGGSDTTAVALAAALDADVCEI